MQILFEIKGGTTQWSLEGGKPYSLNSKIISRFRKTQWKGTAFLSTNTRKKDACRNIASTEFCPPPSSVRPARGESYPPARAENALWHRQQLLDGGWACAQGPDFGRTDKREGVHFFAHGSIHGGNVTRTYI